MPLTDQSRIAAESTRPRILRLWQALQPLRTVTGFMNVGAHPDDETSAMLAALAYRDGLNLSYACATRGEGGQNDIGLESGTALGALRTAEMERAADILGLHLYWLSEGPDDTIFDFGFSKSGSETLRRWTRARTLKRLVHIVRIERPDIICPTFLDIPGQHGHHRAMTETAQLAMQAAADQAFTDCDLPPWQVRKLYLPAWSGAGQSYDDDLPPPPATLVIEAKGTDPISGWSWERIGQQSRACHKTQAMGRWIPAGAERDWPLHLAAAKITGPDIDLTSGLPAMLTDLADFAAAPRIVEHLSAAQTAIDAAMDAFPDFPQVMELAIAALTQVRRAQGDCPDAAKNEVQHRLKRKEQQLSTVIRIAAGVEVVGRLDRDWLRPGDAARLTLETRQGMAEAIGVTVDLPEGWQTEGGMIRVPADAKPTDPYRSSHDGNAPPAPALIARITVQGETSKTRLPFEIPPVILPSGSARLEPDKGLLNLATGQRMLSVVIADRHPEGAAAELELPSGWTAHHTGRGVDITAPNNAAAGLYTLPLMLNGAAAMTADRIAYAHIAPTAYAAPAAVSIRVLHADLPDVKVGYIGGGNDRVGHWLKALGVRVSQITDVELRSETALAGYDALVIGIFAFKSRAGLSEALHHLHAWVENGGVLITLYHRPWDNWHPDKTPPRRLEIGQPSLRWRVTDETAEVRHLIPDHPTLSVPNRIGPDDWAGWHKERGLYFAKSWDAAYTPLLEMADPDDTPHRGALLVASVGKGRHIHTSLVLHHQMEQLVPGAFRLLANMLAKPEECPATLSK